MQHEQHFIRKNKDKGEMSQTKLLQFIYNVIYIIIILLSQPEYNMHVSSTICNIKINFKYLISIIFVRQWMLKCKDIYIHTCIVQIRKIYKLAEKL